MLRSSARFALTALALVATALVATACAGGGAHLQPPTAEPVEPANIDADAAAQRLSKSVTFRTISHQDPAEFDGEEFDRLNAWLEETYPKAHEVLEKTTVNDYTLLYEWPGADPSLKPALFMAHTDVVPALDSAQRQWTHDPFAGTIADGFVWGRGTLDDKVNVLAQLEAVEHLADAGFQPDRTLYFSFGHDEEIGGEQGAAAVAEHFRNRNTEFVFVMDEGMAVIEPGAVPGLDREAALIGTAEKGYVTFRITAEHPGGHSSQPTGDSAIGRLSRAVVALEENQMPARLEGPARDMLRYTQPHMSQPLRFIMGNMWLTGPLVLGRLESLSSGNAMVRTTTAVTMVEGGYKENILPTEASAVVNHRILPGETSDDVERHVRETVGEEIAIERITEANEPSQISRLDAEGLAMIVRTIRELYPDAVVAPALVLGGTDSKHFAEFSDVVYRFAPMRLTSDDLERIHGIDERIAVEDYAHAIAFYIRLLRTAGSATPTTATASVSQDDATGTSRGTTSTAGMTTAITAPFAATAVAMEPAR